MEVYGLGGMAFVGDWSLLGYEGAWAVSWEIRVTICTIQAPQR